MDTCVQRLHTSTIHAHHIFRTILSAGTNAFARRKFTYLPVMSSNNPTNDNNSSNRDNDLFDLSVSGTSFTVPRSILTDRQWILSHIVPDGITDKDENTKTVPWGTYHNGKYFIDVDPQAFRWILHFIRHGSLPRGVFESSMEADGLLAVADYLCYEELVAYIHGERKEVMEYEERVLKLEKEYSTKVEQIEKGYQEEVENLKKKMNKNASLSVKIGQKDGFVCPIMSRPVVSTLLVLSAHPVLTAPIKLSPLIKLSPCPKLSPLIKKSPRTKLSPRPKLSPPIKLSPRPKLPPRPKL